MKHKDHYNDEYVQDFSQKIFTVIPHFDRKTFSRTLRGQLGDKELFARFDCIVNAMTENLPRDYSGNIEAFFDILGPELKQAEGMFTFGWWLWPVSRYVERHGNENWPLSLSFLKELTKRFTGEYAIRPLLDEHPKEIMKELIKWTKDGNVHVRRLSSEAVRIRLPWSEKLLVAIDDFDQYSKILTNLKDDPEKFVQKSVGNNLNDLFKEAPDKAMTLISQWKNTGHSKAQEWIIKHGMRNQNRDLH
ncbi:MAG: DNA alkylation repair protein [Parabacteroides sp.]|nr:DNA alkylation repair protein [Parabacteroides sp.]